MLRARLDRAPQGDAAGRGRNLLQDPVGHRVGREILAAVFLHEGKRDFGRGQPAYGHYALGGARGDRAVALARRGGKLLAGTGNDDIVVESGALVLGNIALGGEKSIGRGLLKGVSASISYKGERYTVTGNGSVTPEQRNKLEGYAEALKRKEKEAAEA